VLPAALYRAVQLGLAPFGFAGYLLWIARLLRKGRSAPSSTALGPLYARWMLHQLGSRKDEAAALLFPALPDVPKLALALVSAPTRIAHALSGYLPQAYRYPFVAEPTLQSYVFARTTFFDQALERALSTADQFVILGAGFDTRMQRLPGDRPLRRFEVDAPVTQTTKLAALARAGVNMDGITYLAADFAHEDWFARLRAAGFDPARRSFFLWEGVSMYLECESVESTLRQIAQCAPGTSISFDYVSLALIQERSLAMKYTRAMLRRVSEPWRFGLDSSLQSEDGLRGWLRSCGLALVDHCAITHGWGRKDVAAGLVMAAVGETSGATREQERSALPVRGPRV
jgi:methyltransferase (TIGR00027 family)